MAGKHHYSLGKSKPQWQLPGGKRFEATAKEFPVLEGMAQMVLELEPLALREPHWHPNANELGFVLSGEAVMTLFSPGGTHDTFILRPGTLAFVPMGVLHHIENTGNCPFKMVLAFSHERPEELSLSQAAGVMPENALAATFGLSSHYFTPLAKGGGKAAFITQRKAPLQPLIEWETARFKFDLSAISPQVSTRGGFARMCNGAAFPALDGLTMYYLQLARGGVREPHWHPNAHELNYLISGAAKITLFSPNGEIDTFLMQPGDISFLPRGYLHYIENIGTALADFAVFFNNKNPSDMGISGSFGAYSNEVLSSLFGVDPTYFENLPKFQHDLLVVPAG